MCAVGRMRCNGRACIEWHAYHSCQHHSRNCQSSALDRFKREMRATHYAAPVEYWPSSSTEGFASKSLSDNIGEKKLPNLNVSSNERTCTLR